MKKAFSLIELSIVLVILGLLVGGILAGKALIRASQIRSIMTQSEQLATAFATFKDKYFALPGEFLLFKSVWPQLDPGGLYCPSTTWSPSSVQDGLLTDTYEIEAAYAQLLAAQLVTMGQPQILSDGTVNPSWMCYANGMLQSAKYYTKFSGITARHSAYQGSNTLIFGDGQRPVLVDEMYALDLKYDDGMPNTGYVFGARTVIPGYCTNLGTGVATDVYRLTDGAACAPIISLRIK